MARPMTRSGSLVLFFALFFSRLALGLYESAPHIIVFMVDDLGWNDVSFHGSNQIPTPNIDALGYNGIILNRHYVLPSSTPSRAAFYTGLYPIRIGMQGESIQGGEPRGLPLDVKILPEYLRDLGYTTKLIGKWHVGYHTSQHIPLQRGFDSFFGFYNSHVSYYDYKYSHKNMTGYDLHRGDVPDYGRTNKYATDLFTDEALKIIESHEPSRPLYLQISHLAVHAPLEGPYDYIYDRRFMHIQHPERRKYARMVTRLDNSIGRVVYALGDRAMLKNSLILFLTDNGAAPIGKFRNYGSNYPLRGMKHTLYEGGVRGVAALWSPKLRKAARVCDELIHITDWLPTLYCAAGGDLRDLGEIDGINQWCMLSEGQPRVRDKLLLNIDEVSRTEGAIFKQYKLIRGSINDGYYDTYLENFIFKNPKMPVEENKLSYTDTILKSTVSQSITYHLGGPVTQPSTMVQLRRDATVHCQHLTYHYNFTICNVTECLFDIDKDPCETKNIAEQFPRMAQELNLLLEQYGRNITNQVKVRVDWEADPQRMNNTWDPWIPSDKMFYPGNAAIHVVGFIYYLHIGMILVMVACDSFV